MPRIRTIKPEFFRHGGLQDLEADHPGQYCMLVFAALLCQCDKTGRFKWQPRHLKLDVLPFLTFDIGLTLELLYGAGYLRKYIAGGEQFGEVVNFIRHQRITGKEAEAPAICPEPAEYELGSTRETTEKYPDISPGSTQNVSDENTTTYLGETPGKHLGNIWETSGVHPDAREGKGKEGNGNLSDDSEGLGLNINKKDFSSVEAESYARIREEPAEPEPVIDWSDEFPEETSDPGPDYSAAVPWPDDDHPAFSDVPVNGHPYEPPAPPPQREIEKPPLGDDFPLKHSTGHLGKVLARLEAQKAERDRERLEGKQ